MRPTDAAMAAMRLSLPGAASTEEQLSPRAPHTVVQLSSSAPMYHCGATVADIDGEAPRNLLLVGVTLPDVVLEGVVVEIPVPDVVAVIVPECEAVAVCDGLAPRVLLLVGDTVGCGQ